MCNKIWRSKPHFTLNFHTSLSAIILPSQKMGGRKKGIIFMSCKVNIVTPIKIQVSWSYSQLYEFCDVQQKRVSCFLDSRWKRVHAKGLHFSVINFHPNFGWEADVFCCASASMLQAFLVQWDQFMDSDVEINIRADTWFEQVVYHRSIQCSTAHWYIECS